MQVLVTTHSKEQVKTYIATIVLTCISVIGFFLPVVHLKEGDEGVPNILGYWQFCKAHIEEVLNKAYPQRGFSISTENAFFGAAFVATLILIMIGLIALLMKASYQVVTNWYECAAVLLIIAGLVLKHLLMLLMGTVTFGIGYWVILISLILIVILRRFKESK